MRLTRDLTHADATVVIADFVGSVCGLPLEEVAAINGSTRFDAAGLSLDSLTRLQLAAAVANFFRLHESELEDELLRRRSVSEWANTVMRGWAEGSKRLTFLTSGTTGERIVELLQALNRERGCTIVLVTHDITLAARTQRTIRLRDGVVVEDIMHVPSAALSAS